MSYLNGQIMDALNSIKVALAQPTSVHGVMGDILQELRQMRIAISELMDQDLGQIDVRDYAPIPSTLGDEHTPS